MLVLSHSSILFVSCFYCVSCFSLEYNREILSPKLSQKWAIEKFSLTAKRGKELLLVLLISSPSFFWGIMNGCSIKMSQLIFRVRFICLWIEFLKVQRVQRVLYNSRSRELSGKWSAHKKTGVFFQFSLEYKELNLWEFIIW